MSYCDVDLIRNLTGLGTGEIRDQRLRNLRDDVAVPRLNDDIQTRVEKEEIKHVRDNIFQLKKVEDSFRSLGDLNDDGEINEEDIRAYGLYEGRRTDFIVDKLIDADKGRFTLLVEKDDGSTEEVKSAKNKYVDYRYAPVNVSEPNQMVSIACAQLTGAFAFSNIETSKLKNFSIGDVTIRKQSDGFAIMHDQYTETMRRIVNRELIEFGENENSIEDVIRRRQAGDTPLGRGKNTTGRFSGG